MQGVAEISVINIIFIMAISVFTGLIIGILIERKTSRNYREAYIEKSERYKSVVYRAQLLYKWITLGERNISVIDLLLKSEWREIAVYGYGVVGKLLVKELTNADFHVPFIIDRRKGELSTSIPTFTLFEILPQCDVIIVTTSNLSEVKGKIGCDKNVILLEDLLNLSQQ